MLMGLVSALFLAKVPQHRTPSFLIIFSVHFVSILCPAGNEGSIREATGFGVGTRNPVSPNFRHVWVRIIVTFTVDPGQSGQNINQCFWSKRNYFEFNEPIIFLPTLLLGETFFTTERVKFSRYAPTAQIFPISLPLGSYL